MNDYRYVKRLATQLAANTMDVSPVVMLMGARQTGKSTLVRSEPFLSQHLYVTLDDLGLTIRRHDSPD